MILILKLKFTILRLWRVWVVNYFSSVHTSVLVSETIVFVLFSAEVTDDSLWFSVCSLSLWSYTALTNFTSVKQLLPFNRLDLFLNIYDQFWNISSHFLKKLLITVTWRLVCSLCLRFQSLTVSTVHPSVHQWNFELFLNIIFRLQNKKRYMAIIFIYFIND